jgi:hypothetical protein
MEQTAEFLIKLDEAQYKTPNITKKEATTAAAKIYSAIMDEGASAVQVAEMFKFVEETQKQLKDITDDNGKNSFTDIVREEIQRNSDNGKSFTTRYGNKFELMEAASKTDCSACGDPIWNDLNEQLEYYKTAIKERETFLKSLKSGIKIDIINPRTGEFFESVEIFPPIKTTTSTYKQTMITG